MTVDTKIMYGTHALQVTVTLPSGESHTQWFCGKCKRIWGRNDKHMASWCCCTHMTCACGKEHSKHYTRCDDCQSMIVRDKWHAKPETEWDGQWPLFDHSSDQYFMDAGDLADYLHELTVSEGHSVHDLIESLRLSSCHVNKPRSFEINEWCCDDLSDDGEIADADSIDDRINAILAEVGTISYSSNSDRLNVRQILASVGYGSTASE